MIELKFSLLEIIDNDFLTDLEAIIVLVGPKECILPTLDSDVSTFLININNKIC